MLPPFLFFEAVLVCFVRYLSVFVECHAAVVSVEGVIFKAAFYFLF